MFTGIVQCTGQLVNKKKGSVPELTLEAKFFREPVKIGDSVAVNGACLTVVSIEEKRYTFNLSGETLDRSNFSDLAPGALLNLELPLTLNDFLGGHLVSGHLDGTARLKTKSQAQGSTRMSFVIQDRQWQRFLIPKGSVTVNGVSLTLAAVSGTGFSVDVIPQTLNSTNLGLLKSGERVNVELDLIGKYLYNFTLKENKYAK